MEINKKLNAEDLFSSLRPEDEQQHDRKFDIKDSELVSLINKYENLYNLKLNIPEMFHNPVLEENYSNIARLVDRKYSSEDISRFAHFLRIYDERENFGFSGLFLSSLINNSSDLNIELKEFESSEKLDCFAYKNNGKTITVNGNPGSYTGIMMQAGDLTINGETSNYLGQYMSGGNIIVNGNTRDFTGDKMSGGDIIIQGNCGRAPGSEMNGGLIEIYGDCGYMPGFKMKKGRIVIHGNSGFDPGILMQGGEIHIDGEYRSIRDIYGGNIFHKGKQIIKDGKPVPGAEIKWK